MNSFWRLSGMLVLLALIIGATASLAQDNNTITVVGSSIVNPLFQALATASTVEAKTSVTDTGTSGGLSQLCAGKADLATATRPISTDEDKACASGNVQYAELLVGHEIAAFVVNPSVSFTECLTVDNLNTLFQPSSQGLILNWNQVIISDKPESPTPSLPLTVVVPASDSQPYVLLDGLVKGDGLRADAITSKSDSDVVAAVSEKQGAVGVASLQAASGAGDRVRIVSLDAGAGAGCAAPSADDVEGRSYTAANRLFLYVNRASLNKTGLKDLLSFMISDQAAATLQSLSFTPPTAQAYDTDKQVLAGSAEGRQFSREVTGFTIPATLAGNVNIDGAADGYDYLKQVSDALTAKYANAKATYKMEGESAGLRRLCNGETDLAVAYNDLSADQAAKCAANNIPTTTINLGAHAVVLLANAKSPYLACLTTAQIGTAWSAVSGGSVTSWAKVSDKFPDVKMTLFAPADGDGYSDLLLAKAAGRPATIRADAAETNSDPLYRAAATANVEGALTLMSWTDYQKVLNNDQANIQLVGVDAGKGCVVPSADTIKNGSYPLTRTTKLIVSLPSLARSEVQSLLWFAMSDDNYKLLEDSGFLGISFGDLPVLRDTLQKDFDQAQIAATAKAEATPEATPEATSTPAP